MCHRIKGWIQPNVQSNPDLSVACTRVMEGHLQVWLCMHIYALVVPVLKSTLLSIDFTGNFACVNVKADCAS